jgi:ankyrin repeat protein
MNDTKSEQLFNICRNDAAINATKLEEVKALIAQGANLKWKNAAGDTALMVACENNHIEIVKLLLD